MVEEKLIAAILGDLREEWQELLQWWRSSYPQQPWLGCGRRGRSRSSRGGAANHSSFWRPAVGEAGAAPRVEEQLTAAT